MLVLDRNGSKWGAWLRCPAAALPPRASGRQKIHSLVAAGPNGSMNTRHIAQAVQQLWHVIDRP